MESLMGKFTRVFVAHVTSEIAMLFGDDEIADFYLPAPESRSAYKGNLKGVIAIGSNMSYLKHRF
jgi:hypothetical protein